MKFTKAMQAGILYEPMWDKILKMDLQTKKPNLKPIQSAHERERKIIQAQLRRERRGKARYANSLYATFMNPTIKGTFS